MYIKVQKAMIVILNKNSLAVKSARPIRSSIVSSEKRPKALISSKAKKVAKIKLLLKVLSLE